MNLELNIGSQVRVVEKFHQGYLKNGIVVNRKKALYEPRELYIYSVKMDEDSGYVRGKVFLFTRADIELVDVLEEAVKIANEF